MTDNGEECLSACFRFTFELPSGENPLFQKHFGDKGCENRMLNNTIVPARPQSAMKN